MHMRSALLWAPAVVWCGCTSVHHVQLDAIHLPPAAREQARSFEVEVDSVGIDAAAAADTVLSQVPVVADVAAMVTMGPRTGHPLYANFTGDLAGKILSRCPSGRVTGLTSTRYSTGALFASREVVRITGYCLPEEAT